MELCAGTGQGRRHARDRVASRHQRGALACRAQNVPALRAARRVGCRRWGSVVGGRRDDDHYLGRVLCGADLGRRARRVGSKRRDCVRAAAYRRLAVAVRHRAASRNRGGAGSAVVRTSSRHIRCDGGADPTRAGVIVILAFAKPAAGAWSRSRSPAGEPLGRVEIWQVSVSFRQGSTVNHALEDTSVDIAPGSFVCLLGPSGCGKSTLLNAVAGYVQPTTGWARVDGAPVLGPGADRGMVFQQYSLFPWKTVRDNVAFGPYATGAGRARARAIGDELLDMVGLARFANRYPAELSGGMQQRVGIARALANKPAVLLMDEPFGALDSQTRAMMQEHLLRLWAEFKITVIFVTHDVDEAIFLADRVLVMSASPGRIIEDVHVPLPRPRDPELTTDAEFIRLKRHFLQVIRAESLKAFEDQDR